MRTPSVPLVLFLAGALAMTAACGPSKDPVVAALDDLVAAAEDRDADDVATALSADFDGGGMDKASLVATVKRYLAAYQSLDVSFSDLESVRKGSSARATFTLHATGVPRAIGGLADLMPRSLTYDCEVALREEDGRWVITQASWTEK